MTYELFINISHSQTRVACIRDTRPVEIHIEHQQKRALVGNIYRGKVVRVLPGMQAAFIDIGLERTAFLHAVDLVWNKPDENTTPQPHIGQRLQLGQTLIVQVTKEALGTKGVRVTTDLALPSRYLVFMPYNKHIGISQRITDISERQRLKEIIAPYASQSTSGYIVRTVAEGVNATELQQDVLFLQQLWQTVVERNQKSSAGDLLYEDLGLMFRAIRDFSSEDLTSIKIDSLYFYEILKAFIEQFTPQFSAILELYDAKIPLFENYEIETAIQAALSSKVELDSGSYLVIEQTEAMTTIDVNTGKFVGKKHVDQTILETNREAAIAIAHQLRWRNLGGIIIIDFIDMVHPEHQEQVLQTLKDALASDRAKTQVYEFSQLGLVEMTRKRTTHNLVQLLTQPCLACAGRGFTRTPSTIGQTILCDIQREQQGRHVVSKLMVHAAPPVIEFLEHEEAQTVASLETTLGIPIQMRAEPLYDLERFDMVIV